MKGTACENCGQEGDPWYESDSPFEYVNGCVECGDEFSYIL